MVLRGYFKEEVGDGSPEMGYLGGVWMKEGVGDMKTGRRAFQVRGNSPGQKP